MRPWTVLAEASPEVRRLFDDDQAAGSWLAAQRWPGGLVCSTCGCKRHHRLVGRPRVFCCSDCGHQTSVTAGTALHKLRLPLSKLVKALWYVNRHHRNVSARALSQFLDVAYGTAWTLYHKIRAALTSGLVVPDTPVISRAVRRGRALASRPVRRDPPPVPREFVVSVAVHGPATRWGRRAVVFGNEGVDDEPRDAREMLWYASGWLARVYRGVSARWLPRYLAQRAFSHNYLQPKGDLLAEVTSLVTRCRWLSARDLPPVDP